MLLGNINKYFKEKPIRNEQEYAKQNNHERHTQKTIYGSKAIFDKRMKAKESAMMRKLNGLKKLSLQDEQLVIVFKKMNTQINSKKAVISACQWKQNCAG